MKLTTHDRTHRRVTIILLLVSSLAGLTLATKPTTISQSSSAADKQKAAGGSNSLQASPSEQRDLLAVPSAIDGTADAVSKSQKAADSSAAASGGLAIGPIAEKKQGDVAAAAADSSLADLFNSDDYVQVKPEEIIINENGHLELNPAAESSSSSSSSSVAADSPVDRQLAEHKSVDEELNAQLTQDVIHEQESAAFQQAHSSGEMNSVNSPMEAASSVSAGYQQQQQYEQKQRSRGSPNYRGGSAMRYHQQQQQYGGGEMSQHAPVRPAPGASYQGGRGPRQPRMPPSYMALKGKLTGINSLVSQYPHPAPGYPHQGPRHLPRGAAAGYAAFRDFVRAHASKYKNTAGGPAPAQPGAYGPPPPPPQALAYEAGQAKDGYRAPVSGPSKGPAGYGAPAPVPAEYGSAPAKRSPSKTKVTVAQAYIPHLASNAANGYGSSQSSPPSSQYEGQQMNSYANQVLSKLYGANAPQGAGRPEYSKDFGMVIHYPQATVYTEPMTVEQLHKLTGSGISQLLEQLQYNLAHGHRDEANTLRANDKHHIGAGISIQAKEYYAQGKGGRYIPATAAVISTEQGGGYESSLAAGSPLEQGAYGSSGPKAHELGSGYERVKLAAQAGGAKYSNGGGQSDHQQQVAAGYEMSSSAAGKYNGGGGPDSLAAIANLIGAELDALYKTNGNKKSAGYGKPADQRGGQKYGQSQMGSYGAAQPHGPTGLGPRKGPRGNRYHMQKQQQHYQQPRPAMMMSNYGGGHHHQARPRHHRHSQKHQQQGVGHGKPMGPGGQQGYGQRAHPQQYQQQQLAAQGYQQQQPQQQQQQQSYQAEQAMSQQMVQLLHEIQAGDDQYNNKNNPLTRINHQAYPPKVMQKYPQQQQAYGAGNAGSGAQAHYQQQHQQQLQSSYTQHDSMEIPQGPNDQIGEIADLIEALKGSLESGKMDGAAHESNSGKQASDGASNGSEHIRYLTSALAQSPAYSMQVPVNSGGEAASGYDSSSSSDSANGGAGSYQKGAEGASSGYQQQQAQDSAGYSQQAGAGPSGQQESYAQAAAAVSGGYGTQSQDSAGYNQQAGEYQAARDSNNQQLQQQQSAAMMMFQDAYALAPAAAAGQSEHYQAPAGNGGYAMQPTPVSGSSQQYGRPSSSYGTPTMPEAQNVISGAYQQQQGAVSAPPPMTNSGSYPSSEHTQVINHLVPVAPAHQQAAPTPSSSSSAGYGADSSASSSSSQHQEQPANQIALAAPTESQYQQAQSLSSFVDSLPNDYQDLLRQPALIDGHSSASHLAILAGGQQHATSKANGGNHEHHHQQQQANNGAYSMASATASAPSHASSSHYEPLSAAASSASVTRQLAPLTSKKAASSSSASSSSPSSLSSPSTASSSAATAPTSPSSATDNSVASSQKAKGQQQ